MATQQLFIGRVHVGFEIQRNGIHAIALVGGRRTIIENVSQMRVASAARNLRACHTVGLVDRVLRGTLANVFEETRPTATAVKFRIGAKQRITTHRAVIGADNFIFVVLPCECTLSMRLAGYEI